jgi:hypothetical protein
MMPFAAKVGVSTFVPLVVVTSMLGWFSYIVLGVEGRYVGAR